MAKSSWKIYMAPQALVMINFWICFRWLTKFDFFFCSLFFLSKEDSWSKYEAIKFRCIDFGSSMTSSLTVGWTSVTDWDERSFAANSILSLLAFLSFTCQLSNDEIAINARQAPNTRIRLFSGLFISITLIICYY